VNQLPLASDLVPERPAPPPPKEPAWLELLAHENPSAAKTIASDSRRKSKLDRVLRAMPTDADRVEVVLMALEGEMDPDDPSFAFMGKILKLTGDALGATERQTRALKNQALALSGSLENINDTVQALPAQISESHHKLLESNKDALDTYASTRAHAAIDEVVRDARESVSREMQSVTTLIADIRTNLAPVETLAKLLSREATVAIGVVRAPRKVFVAAGGLVALGVLCGFLGCAWLVNTTGFGLTPRHAQDLRYGETYRTLVPVMPHDMRAWIAAYLARTPK
jgi:hypothetical protein